MPASGSPGADHKRERANMPRPSPGVSVSQRPKMRTSASRTTDIWHLAIAAQKLKAALIWAPFVVVGDGRVPARN